MTVSDPASFTAACDSEYTLKVARPEANWLRVASLRKRPAPCLRLDGRQQHYRAVARVRPNREGDLAMDVEARPGARNEGHARRGIGDLDRGQRWVGLEERVRPPSGPHR